MRFYRDLVFGAGDDAVIYAWDLNTGEKKLSLSGHYSKVTGLVFHQDTNQLVR